MTPPRHDGVPWTNQRERGKHGAILGRATESEYEASALATIRVGTRFTFRDNGTGKRRVGYYDLRNQRITVLDEAEATIVTHFVCEEGYVRQLQESDCVR
jgi:hypothetical protein